jgi:Protein of unknwon function (DUF3310)
LTNTSDPVDHPAHYNQHPSGVECIDVVEHMSFNIGNAVKYLWRVGLKPGTSSLEDLKKAAWYVNREIERVECQRSTLASTPAVKTAPWSPGPPVRAS